MLEHINNLKYKYISFPVEEYIAAMAKEPDKFDFNIVLEYIIGGFGTLLVASELYHEKMSPDWKSPEAIFIYSLSSFEIDFLESLSDRERQKLFNPKNIKAEVDFTREKKRVKGYLLIDFSVSVAEEIKDRQLCFKVKLELENIYSPEQYSFSDKTELNSFIANEISHVHKYLWKTTSELLKISEKKQVKKTISSIPTYLNFATSPLVQELRKIISINQKDLPLISQKKEGQFAFELEKVHDDFTNQIFSLNDLTVDVLNGIIHLWIKKKVNDIDPIFITTDDLLFIRSKKPVKNADGCYGGYRKTDREEIEAHIDLLSKLKVEVKNLVLPSENQSISGQSKVLSVSKWHNTDSSSFYFLISPGEILKLILNFPQSNVGIIHKKIAEYDHYRHFWEKRIGNYLAWIWKKNWHKRVALDVLTVESLLNQVKTDFSSSRPNEIRNRLENALDKLNKDNVIKSWHYKDINEDNFLKQGWYNEWLKLNLVILPPDELKTEYIKLKNKDSFDF